MTPEDFQRVRELFLAIRELGVTERSAYLDQACVDQPLIRKEVEILLAHGDDPHDLLKVPGQFEDLQSGLEQAFHAEESESMPARIGSYAILEILGEGGMGVVYLAQQEQPRRKVALKVVRPGSTSRTMLRRLEHEANILGHLEHPGIARIHEAGVADMQAAGGRTIECPFFAMEYVRGEPLTAYVKRQNLGTRQRLALIADICDAVHHAHQKGVIHRDLKPGNILVDEQGQPKILDFGVARATDADVQTFTMQTEVGQLIGTISYMSPEQVTGVSANVDTRSDVYAIGVIMYELLTGRVPHDLTSMTIPQAVRTIEQEDSAPLSSIDKVFRGDVDTIAAKALEKDKQRRYQSASDLAADIRRYLTEQPIAARPVTTIYQLRKFARRNKGLVSAVLVAFAALLIGIIGTTSQAIRATRKSAEAQRQAAIAKAVNRFLTDDLLAAASPLSTPDRDITMREVLDAAADSVAGQFEDEPVVAASIHYTLGTTYWHLGAFETAAHHLTEALDLQKDTLGEEHLNTLMTMAELAVVYKQQGLYDEAEKLNLQALESKRALLGDRHAETATSINNLAALYHAQGRHDEAEPLYREALDLRREINGEEHLETLTCLGNLGNLYHDLGRYDEAEAMHTQALEGRRRTLGDENVYTLFSMNALAKVYHSKKEYDRAEPLWQEVLDSRRRSLGEQHSETLKTMNNLAALYKERERYGDAEKLWIGVLAAQRDTLGEEHPHTLVSAINLADLYRRMKKYEEAAGLFATTIKNARSSLPQGHWYLGVFLDQQGICLTSLERFSEAEAALLEAHQILSTALGPDHRRTKATLKKTVKLYEAWDKPEKAAEYRTMLLVEEPPATAEQDGTTAGE